MYHFIQRPTAFYYSIYDDKNHTHTRWAEQPMECLSFAFKPCGYDNLSQLVREEDAVIFGKVSRLDDIFDTHPELFI